jgi:hypothetical protein
MSMKLTVATLLLGAACAAAAQSVPEMRMTPEEVRALAVDGDQIGSSGLPGVHTKVLFGDRTKAGSYAILLFVAPRTTIQAQSWPNRHALLRRGERARIADGQVGRPA